MAIETYDAIIKLPIGKKKCTLTFDIKGDGTYEGDFAVLGSCAPVKNGKIDEDGNFTAECTITTMLGTMEGTAEGRIFDGKIDGVAKARIGVMPLKSPELW